MRFKSIDSLRGIAASLVLLYHVWNRFFPSASCPHPGIVAPVGALAKTSFFLFGFGYLGVNLFFVVSGLCIHLPQALKFAAKGSDQLSLKRFALRRFWRLYPALFASLVWTSVALLVFPAILSLLRRTPLHFAAAADIRGFWISAFFLEGFFKSASSFNGVYWTLVYELQFYIFYPFLLRICRKIGFLWPCVILLAMELGLSVTPLPGHYIFLCRYFEWFLGMWLAESVANGKKIRLPYFLAPILIVLAITSVFYAPMLRDVLASAAFALLLAACMEHEHAWTWIRHPRLVAIGTFSYSLYLVHVPVIDLFWKGTAIVRSYHPSFPLATIFLSIPASFLLGYVFFQCFERPFLGLSSRAGKLPVKLQEQAW